MKMHEEQKLNADYVVHNYNAQDVTKNIKITYHIF